MSGSPKTIGLTVLSWWIAAMFGLALLATSLMTFAPSAWRLEIAMFGVTGSASAASLAWLAWVRRLPDEHRVHRSKLVWSLAAAAAILATLFVAWFAGLVSWFAGLIGGFAI
jgi:hypothetical protein